MNVTKVDVYKSQGIAERLGIDKFPAIAFIKDNKVIKVLIEDITMEEMETLI